MCMFGFISIDLTHLRASLEFLFGSFFFNFSFFTVVMWNSTFICKRFYWTSLTVGGVHGKKRNNIWNEIRSTLQIFFVPNSHNLMIILARSRYLYHNLNFHNLTTWRDPNLKKSNFLDFFDPQYCNKSTFTL